MTVPKKLVFNEDHYFGHCHYEKHENYYLNIGKGHWMVCDHCQVKWFIGENLFSSWKSENTAIWKANLKRIEEYSLIEI